MLPELQGNRDKGVKTLQIYMPPEEPQSDDKQKDLFRVELERIIDGNHPLVKLSKQINWREFDEAFSASFCEDNGRPGCSTRLMVGLHYLKHTFDLSDEESLERWVDSPHWQYFCGMKYFEHQLPIHYSSMSRWRKRIAEAGAEKMLAESIQTGLKSGVIKPKMLEKVNVDTTVEEKNIRFPTDARLYDRMREHLVKEALKQGLILRQSYRRVGRKTLLKQSRYAHAQQFKRAQRMTRRLKTLLGRVVRDIQRKAGDKVPTLLKEKLGLAQRLLKQQRQDSKKIYSIHEPHVECICKGKIHKRYEFGCKVSIISTSKGNWILTSQAIHGNPYDGKTLASSLKQAQRVSGQLPKQAFCDLGYRGHEKVRCTTIKVVPQKRKHLSRSLRHWMNRRAAIEPIIGHLKADHRFERNRLKGKLGDQLNALLSACGFNFRKLMRAFFLPICFILSLCILWLNPHRSYA